MTGRSRDDSDIHLEISWEASWKGLGSMPRKIKAIIWLAAATAFMALSGAVFWGCCVDFVDSYELGYRYDKRTGVTSKLQHTGYVLHAPVIVEVHKVDLRPMQVCINANARVLNCKLVRFNPDGLELFLSWHGRTDYMSGPDTDFNHILLSYAYDWSGKSYPFLDIIRELKPEAASAAR